MFNQIVEHLKSFNELVAEKGKIFQILFYLFLGLLLVFIGSNLIWYILYLSFYLTTPLASDLSIYLTSMISFYIILTILVIYLLKKNNLYGLLILSLIIPTYVIFEIIVRYIYSRDLIVQLLFGFVFLIYGMVYSFLFNKVSNSSIKLIYSSIFFSVIGSIYFIKYELVGVIGKLMTSDFLSTNSLLSSSASLQPINTAFFFILFLIFFNLPFIRYFLSREDKKKKYLWLYLIPIIAFILFYLLMYSFVAPMSASILPINEIFPNR